MKRFSINQKYLKCFECKRTGHVSIVCVRSLLDRKSNSVDSVQEDVATAEYGPFQVVDIYQNKNTGGNLQSFYVQMDMERIPIKFESDTGSLLRTRHYFAPDGKIRVNINYKGKIIQDDICIVPEE